MSRLIQHSGGRRSASGAIILPDDPTAEPVFTNASNQHALLNTDLTETWYQDASQMGEYPFSADDPFYGPFRIIPEYSFLPHGTHTNPAISHIVNDTAGKWLRAEFSGVGASANGWLTWPTQPASTVRTTIQSFYQRWNIASGAVLPQVKNNEVWWTTLNPEDSGRAQIATVPDAFGEMFWEIHDQVTSNPRTALWTPLGGGLRDIADGQPHLVTIRSRPHAKNPATVNRLVSIVNPYPFTGDTFEQSQAGVLYDGARVHVISHNVAGTVGDWCSGAEFIVSHFDGDKRATLTRQPDIQGGTVSYAGAVIFSAPVTYKGVFSASMAGQVSNGTVLSMNNSQNMVPTRVVAFDGSTICELPQDDPSAINLSIVDSGGLWFATPADRTGFIQMWIDHQKLIDCSVGSIGITPPGGRQPWTTAQAHTTLVVGASFAKIIWGETQANASAPWSMDIGVIPGKKISVWWEP